MARRRECAAFTRYFFEEYKINYAAIWKFRVMAD
jgi:hypothetical protein